VCINARDDERGRVYIARNEEPVPVTVLLEFGLLRNLRSPEDGRIERVIPANSTERIRLSRFVPGPIAGNLGWQVLREEDVSADVSISIDLGASATEPDDYVYAVPFGGTAPRPLIQGFNGDETHLGDMRYALDIAMPQNTPILAARDGVILYLQDGYTEGGADPAFLERANLVVVAHEDGTMASYGHLSKGIEVAVGDTVEVGQLLGWSGQTGFAGLPHLHFHEGVRMLGEPGRTIPIALKGADGRLMDLTNGVAIPPARSVPQQIF